ncbi:MAG: hypothetical protein KDD73_10735 [Anaerolineales bacterium]|nr:hypothetical protein [Anaerolineales bacterium]MCB9128063.1 hypothetical protein [Ardenticatenales bacterium]
MKPDTASSSQVVQDARELLFARLDLEGEGAALREVAPQLSEDRMNAAELWAYQSTNPDLYFAFYIFESSEALRAAQPLIDEASSAHMPEQAVYDSATMGAILMTGYYIPDDPDDFFDPATVAFYEVFGRVGGEE